MTSSDTIAAAISIFGQRDATDSASIDEQTFNTKRVSMKKRNAPFSLTSAVEK